MLNKNLEVLLCGSDIEFEKLLEELHDNLQEKAN